MLKMKLIIKNIGIVESAEIDLSSDFTLFCGPNGTGKTYVAYILNELFNTFATDFKFTSLHENPLDFNHTNVFDITESHVRAWSESISKKLTANLPSIFGLSASEAKRLFPNPSLHVQADSSDFAKIIDGEVDFSIRRGTSKVVSCSKKSGEKFFSILPGEGAADLSFDAVREYIILAYGLAFKDMLIGERGARMLTVERNSIYTFKNELTSNRIDAVDQVLISGSSDAEKIIKSRSSLYPGAVRASLAIATDLVNLMTNESEYMGLAHELESSLLAGDVSLGKEGDVRFTPSISDGKNETLPIKMSSSSVKTLSGLVVYLKHIAKRGELLIVDEPEMNLHPDNQRILARIFAKMLNNGIRLILSTHSDYIIREINNLIMANALKGIDDGAYSETGFDDSMLIDRKRMTAYLFNFNSNGLVSSSKMPLDDFGLEAITIDAAIESQNEVTIFLRDSLEAYE